MSQFSNILKLMWSYIFTYIWNPLKQLISPSHLNSNERTQGAKPTSEIPGPKGLPLIGDILQFNKTGGSVGMIDYVSKLHKEYGRIFKTKLGPTNLVFISDPVLYKESVRQEPRCPQSMKLPVAILFHDIHKMPRGLFFQNGEEWFKARSLLTKVLLKDTGSFMETIFKPVELILINFMKRWTTNCKSNDGLIPAELDCYELFIRAAMALTFGAEYEDYLSKTGSDIRKLSEDAIELNACTEELNKYPPKVARAMGLSVWNRFEEITLSNLKIGRTCTALVLAAMNESKNGGSIDQFGLIHRLKHVGGVGDDEIGTQCTDFVSDISDPCGLSLLWILLTLGRHPKAQDKVVDEINTVLGPGSVVTYKDLDSLPYLNATFKEVLRVTPSAPFVARVLDEDTVIGGYTVPKEYVLVMSTIVSHNDPNLFEEPNKFSPERWLENSDEDDHDCKNSPPQKCEEAYHPFGMGKRMCAGKLLASTLLKLFIASVVPNFRIESAEVKKKMKTMMYPDGEIEVKLIPRMPKI